MATGRMSWIICFDGKQNTYLLLANKDQRSEFEMLRSRGPHEGKTKREMKGYRYYLRCQTMLSYDKQGYGGAKRQHDVCRSPFQAGTVLSFLCLDLQ